MGWIAALAAAGGAAASAGGSASAAGAANSATDDQRDEQRNRGVQSAFYQMSALYGPDFARAMMGMYDAVQTNAEGHGSQKIDAILNDPAVKKVLGEKGTVQQLQDIADQFIGSGDKYLNQYTNQTNSLQQAGQGLSGGLANYGAGRARSITQDSADSLRSANAQTMARANATGLGSSTFALNALAGNARMNERDKQKALQNLGDSQIDRRTAQGNTNIGTLANRYAGQTSLWGSLQDRNLNLRLAPITARSQGFGQIGQMWSQMPVQQGAGYSPGGSFASNLGNAAAQFGSAGLARYMNQPAPATPVYGQQAGFGQYTAQGPPAPGQY